VVFFFPKAFTPGCTKEAGEFRERFEELKKGGGTVIGVSTDPQEKVDRALHKVVSYEPADFAEDDGRIDFRRTRRDRCRRDSN